MTGHDAGGRLDRLEGYLREDPSNAALLRDAFETALQAGDPARAEFHLRHGQALGQDAEGWALREAHWLLAQQRWHEAREHLAGLAGEAASSAAPEWSAAIAQDLAYVDLRLGDHAAGVARLAPQMEGGTHAAGVPVEITWLRLLHHGGEIERAMKWLEQREPAGGLDPAVAGVAALLALDQGDYEKSLRWSTRSLAGDSPAPVEAAVARASLALAERRADLARPLLASALERNAGDGRTWSAIGFTELLEQNLPAAREAFVRATAAMPGHVGTWHGLGWTAIAQRDLPAASAAFDAALALDRNFAESHGGVAVVLALSGSADAGRQAAARALGLDRSCLSARYAEALLQGDGRDAASVARLAERLLGGKQAPLGGDLLRLLQRSTPSGPGPTST